MAKTEAASGLKPLYSFEELVIGPHNQVAVGACMEVVKSPGETYNPLFVYGPPGVGKTHLMQAVAHELLKKNTEFKIRYISAERFMSEVLTAISEDRMLDVRRFYSLLDLLIIDDVQYMTESKISQEELFHVFNNLHQANRQVILAADRPPNQLTTLNKNIRSRLEWGLSTDIRIPEEPTRIEILKKKQHQLQGIDLTSEMFAYVARNLKSNVRELEGFLKRIHAYVTLSHQDLTMDLVKSVVKEICPEIASEPESLEPPPAKKKSYTNGHAVGAPAPKAAPPPPAPAPPPPPPPKPAPPPPPVIEKIADTRFEEPISQKQSDQIPFDLFLESIESVQTPESLPTPARPAPPPPPAAVSEPVKQAAPPPPPVALAPAKKAPPPFEPVEMASPPPAPAAPKAPPALAPLPAVPEPVAEEEADEDQSAHKEILAVFFYPEAASDALETVSKKFQEVIRKHKLKFRLRGVHNQPYVYKGKINYAGFVDVCKTNKVPVAIVIGPPPDSALPQQDFYDLLTVTLDVQGVSLQLVNWSEIHKDYRYLNLALDIALVRSR